MPKHIVTIIGSLNTDLVTTTRRIPSGGETLTATSFSTGSGGKGANQAVACARLSRYKSTTDTKASDPRSLHDEDVIVKMIGAVGSDEFGPRMISGLESDGIDTSRVRVVEGENTGVAIILVEEQSGENRILLNPGANYTLRPQDFEDVDSLGTVKPDLIILQLEIPLMTVLSIIRTAKKAHLAVLLNPAPAVELPQEVYENLDHLILNESEAMILSGRGGVYVDAAMDWGSISDDFLRKGVKNVVVTLGAKGAYASKKIGAGVMVDAEKVTKVVDTTAAGDTFVGAYAVEAVRDKGGGLDMEKAVRWACRAAGRTIERQGAQNAIPWADDVLFHEP